MSDSAPNPAVLRLAGFGILPVRIFLLSAAFWVQPAHAQAALTITNLAQVTSRLTQQDHFVADVQLEATVAACSTNTGVLILEDASGLESVELEGFNGDLHRGDVVRIESDHCFLKASEFGVYLSKAPVINNDGLHAARTVDSEMDFDAGRYPVTIDWFNQFSAFILEVSCMETNSSENPPAGAYGAKLLQATQAECFHGFWNSLPNFQLLQPVKGGQVTNFDIGIRDRDDMVGIRFTGYFDALRAGRYYFSLNSDDGSRLWIGNPAVAVKKIGTNEPPAALAAIIGAPMSLEMRFHLVTVKGRVSFVSRLGKGLQLEIRSGREAMFVKLADAGTLVPSDLLNALVCVSGLAQDVPTEEKRLALGGLIVASAADLAVIENAPGKGELPPVLTTVMQVHSLSGENAERSLPVKIEGVVTAVGQRLDHWVVIHDDMRGSFIRLVGFTNRLPVVGEVWAVTGVTGPGDFAPVVVAERLVRLGKGRLPEPAHVGWSQLVNGSMDVQWVEIEGMVTAVSSNRLTLMFPEGHQEITLPEWEAAELSAFDKAVVRIRGTLFASWNPQTHEVLSGVTMRNASISVEKPAPEDPFSAPEKTPRGLFHFDARATPFQRVKVRGQVTYVDSQRVFIQHEAGIQILPAVNVSLQAGDWVEAVGFPEILGASPLLREALLRKTRNGFLPAAPLVSASDVPADQLAASRIQIEGILAGQHAEDKVSVLQIQTQSHIFIARVGGARALRSLRVGSQLSLIGVYVADVGNTLPANGVSPFELLVNEPGDVTVLSEPSWWTFQRLVSVVGVLLVTLALAVAWITQLKRQVAQRTLQLQHEIRERERVERQREIEAERSRIARDLHDDLGSSLTEINVLASTGQRPHSGDGTHPALFKAIADKARSLVAALDVIVWAVDPEDNSLQSLADYLSGYAREFLSNSKIACRFKIPITFPEAMLAGPIRHEVLMVVKETLNNIVRHAGATEVEFQMAMTGDFLEIVIADNGKGFNPNAGTGGHGLKNRLTRLTSIGGSCQIESRDSFGTVVSIRLRVSTAKAGQSQE